VESREYIISTNGIMGCKAFSLVLFVIHRHHPSMAQPADNIISGSSLPIPVPVADSDSDIDYLLLPGTVLTAYGKRLTGTAYSLYDIVIMHHSRPGFSGEPPPLPVAIQ
jgi:hypothetical protein